MCLYNSHSLIGHRVNGYPLPHTGKKVPASRIPLYYQ